MTKRIWLAGGAVAALAAGFAGGGTVAFAAEAATQVDTVVVTVRKRVETAYDVPGPVTVADGRRIDALKLNDARDLIMLVPTAFLQESIAGSARDINIRGVGTPNIFAEPGVSQYLDGVYVSSFITQPMQFYDLERVEALRGPQGGLYGRNAVGGAVNIISKLPTATRSAEIEASFGNLSRTEVRGFVNLPLSDHAALRLTAWRNDQEDGEYFNPVTKHYLDREDATGFRLVGAFEPAPDTSLNLVAEVTNASAPGTVPVFPGLGEKRLAPRDFDPVNDIDTWRVSGEAKAKTPIGALTVLAGLRRYKLHGLEDTDLSQNAGTLAERRLFRDNIVDGRFLEARLAGSPHEGVDLLGGFTYIDDDGLGKVLSTRPSNLEPNGTPAQILFDNDQSLKSWSAFAEANLNPHPQLTVTLDLRYTNDRKGVDFALIPTPKLQPTFGAPQSRSLSRTFDNWSPGATVEWRFTPDLKIYAKAQEGFRAGGFNFNVAKVANLPYDEEKSTNLEAGLKGRLFDRRLTWSATAFSLTQRDVLVSLFDFTATVGLQAYLDNVGRARTNGLEFELNAQPVDNVSFGGSVGILDATFTRGPANIVGKDLPASRPLTWMVYGSWRAPVADRVALTLDASYAHRDEGFLDPANLSKVSDSNVLNVQSGIELSHFTVAAYVQNALDDRYDLTFGGFRSGQFGVLKAPGKRYGFTLKARF